MCLCHWQSWAWSLSAVWPPTLWVHFTAELLEFCLYKYILFFTLVYFYFFLKQQMLLFINYVTHSNLQNPGCNFIYVSAIKVTWKGHLHTWLFVCKGTKYKLVTSQAFIGKVCCLKLILYLGCIRPLLVRRSWDSLILNIKNKIKN